MPSRGDSATAGTRRTRPLLPLAGSLPRPAKTLRSRGARPLARLPELVAEFGEFALDAGVPTSHYEIRRARVGTMLASLDDLLPACRVIAFGSDFADASKLEKRTIGVVTVVALDELAELVLARR